jgi:hypothetical protein
MSDWAASIPEEKREDALERYAAAKTVEDKVKVLISVHPRGYVNLEPVQNLDDYFRYVRLCSNDLTWFRGESKDHMELKPRLYRGVADKDIAKQYQKEREAFREFRRRGRSLASQIEIDDIWSWYFLIQHYGGMTRLLDWTTDAAVALYFALEGPSNGENPIVISLQAAVLTSYAFEAADAHDDASSHVLYPGEGDTEKWMNSITSDSNKMDNDMPEAPIPLLPPYADDRIRSQSSCFTLFGKGISGFVMDGTEIVCPTCRQKMVHRMLIDGSKNNALRTELKRVGVTSGKVYPGLDGLAKEITEEVFGSIK